MFARCGVVRVWPVCRCSYRCRGPLESSGQFASSRLQLLLKQPVAAVSTPRRRSAAAHNRCSSAAPPASRASRVCFCVCVCAYMGPFMSEPVFGAFVCPDASRCVSVCAVEKPHTALCCLFSVGAAGLTFAEQELRQHELLLAGRAALRLSDISPQVGTSFLLITSYLCAEKALRETREHLYSFYGQA